MAKKCEQFYAKHGYESISTGGGCTAYHKAFNELGLYVLITSDVGDGSQEPKTLIEHVSAGLYSRNDAQAVGYVTAPSSPQLLAKMCEGLWKEASQL